MLTKKEIDKLRNLLRIQSDLQAQSDYHIVSARTIQAKMDTISQLVQEILDKQKKPLTGGKA